MKTKKKVALLGGSFDPVHDGHLQLAQSALEGLHADEVWFIPTNQTPLKERKLSSTGHRVEMLRRALENHPEFKIYDQELYRPGVSYTVDTLQTLKEQFPDTEFVWVLGQDQAANFKNWRDWQKLLELADFAVAGRPEAELALDPYLKEKMIPLEMEPVDVSSTEIRQGNKLNYLSENVLDYILEHELYLIPWIKRHLSPHRLAHSLSVARICRDLAQCHNLDAHKAYLAGLFHDVCKDLDPEILKEWMDVLFKDQKIDHEALWHGYVGAEVVDRFYGIHDPQIKNAIFNHTKGSSYDPYAMILFIADKVDPLRGYDSSAMIEAARRDLYMGFMMVRRENKEFLKKSLMHN